MAAALVPLILSIPAAVFPKSRLLVTRTTAVLHASIFFSFLAIPSSGIELFPGSVLRGAGVQLAAMLTFAILILGGYAVHVTTGRYDLGARIVLLLALAAMVFTLAA